MKGVEIFELDVRLRKDGRMDYNRPAREFRNRVRDDSGSWVDPGLHENTVVAGYVAAFSWLVENKGMVREILDDIVDEDFKIRFLVRKTRHYASVIHMLNLPRKDDYLPWVELVISRFRNSGHFLKEVPWSLVDMEARALLGRDIPYFWMRAGETAIFGNEVAVHSLPFEISPKQAALDFVGGLQSSRLDVHTDILREFLRADMSGSIVGENGADGIQ